MKIVRTLFALAILSFLTSCAKENLSELDALVKNDIEYTQIDARKNVDEPRIVEITTDVIRPYQFTTQD